MQIVQEAAKDAAQLTVFQRSPVMALPMVQRRMTEDDQRAAKRTTRRSSDARNRPPGSFYDIAPLEESALAVSARERDAVYERLWAAGGFSFWAGTFSDVLVDEAANRTAYDFWRDKTRARVHDPRVAELLAPTEPPYPFGTKRPSLEQDYYDVFNQDNVTLVDLRTEPIMNVTPAGVQTTEKHYDLDVLVLATGFDANTGGLTAIDIRGVDGRSLADRWSDGVDTYLGMAVAGFPNLLFLYGPQSPTAFCNGPTCAELQGDWVVECLSYLRDHGSTRLDTSEKAATDWSAHLDEIGSMTLLPRADSWYMAANIPGKRRQLLNYPMTDAYLERLHTVAAERLRGLHPHHEHLSRAMMASYDGYHLARRLRQVGARQRAGDRPARCRLDPVDPVRRLVRRQGHRTHRRPGPEQRRARSLRSGQASPLAHRKSSRGPRSC